MFCGYARAVWGAAFWVRFGCFRTENKTINY